MLVLCYHALSPTWDAALSTTPERFERQMKLLRRRGYRAATFAEAVLAPPGERVVAVTFDDAYRSVLDLARPILDSLGMTATVFAPTDFIGLAAPMSWDGIDRWHGGLHERELLPMSWEELRALVAAGWEVGSHTVSHPHLTSLDDRALERELESSKAACELELDMACGSLAYPYGDIDARVIAAAARAGYHAAASLPEGALGPRLAMAWPRIGVYRVDSQARFRVKVARTVRRARTRKSAGES